MSDELSLPTINAFLRELEQARNVAATLQDYRNANMVLQDQFNQLQDRMVYVQERAEAISQESSTVGSRLSDMSAKLFEAQADRLTFESQNARLLSELDKSKKAQENLQNMNSGISESLDKLEAQNNQLREELAEKTTALEVKTDEVRSLTHMYETKLKAAAKTAEDAREGQFKLQQMNTGLNQTIIGLESKLRIAVRDADKPSKV